ncbi:hypothetical protein [uncultured Sulfitobacter sp.]|uniref:hypothetical protein n=1 Tax=uncultured Sulfitobacter sp. TaxID=191468 RepID=UPI002591ECF4|nr:hypothetical protein [uncultured Sulfitobacter sp.]
MYYMIGIDGPEEFEGGYRAVAHHHYDDTTGIGHGARPMQAVLQAVRATGVNDKVLTQLAVQVELDEIAWKMNEVVKGVQRSVGQSLRRPLLDLEGMIGEVRGYMP